MSRSVCAAHWASLHPLRVTPGGRTPPRPWAWRWEEGTQEGHSHRGGWKQGDDTAWWGDLSLGPWKELLPHWGPLSHSQKPLEGGGGRDQIPLRTRKLRTEATGLPRSHSWRERGGAGNRPPSGSPPPRAQVAATATMTRKPSTLLWLPFPQSSGYTHC